MALLASCALVMPAVADKLADVIPVADMVPESIDIPEPAVSAPCFELSAVYSALLNKPAVVPVTLAEGIFKVCTVPFEVKDGVVLVAAVVVENV
jgi:hypothetical protein